MKLFLLFIWIIQLLFYIFGKSKRVAIRFDNRLSVLYLQFDDKIRIPTKTCNPFDWGFLFYTSFQKANRIETMVDKYTKHSILNAMQESRNIGIGGK